MYIKFMFTLTVGLVGCAMVMKTLLETLLHEWDVVADARRGWNAMFNARPHSEVRAEDILMELEQRDHMKRRLPERSIDRRREALREVREAEHRLAVPQAPEVV